MVFGGYFKNVTVAQLSLQKMVIHFNCLYSTAFSSTTAYRRVQAAPFHPDPAHPALKRGVIRHLSREPVALVSTSVARARFALRNARAPRCLLTPASQLRRFVNVLSRTSPRLSRFLTTLQKSFARANARLRNIGASESELCQLRLALVSLWHLKRDSSAIDTAVFFEILLAALLKLCNAAVSFRVLVRKSCE